MILRKTNHLFKLLGLCLLLVAAYSCSKDDNTNGDNLNALIPPSGHKLSYSANKSLYSKADTTRKNGDGNKVSAPFQIDKVKKEGDILKVTVSFSGGCSEHTFKVIWSGQILLTDPCQINLILTHNDQDDTCTENVTETLEIDLKKLFGDADNSENCYINVYSIFNGSDDTPDVVYKSNDD